MRVMRVKCGHEGCDKTFKSMAGRAAHRRYTHGISAHAGELTTIHPPLGDANDGLKAVVEDINNKPTKLQTWALEIAHELLDVKMGVRTLADDEIHTLHELREILAAELPAPRATSHDTSHDTSHAVRTAI